MNTKTPRTDTFLGNGLVPSSEEEWQAFARKLETENNELTDLVLEAMENPPRGTPAAGANWEERALKAVGLTKVQS